MYRSITLTIMLLASLGLHAQVGFQISPGKVFFRQRSGEPVSQTVKIMNPTTTEMTMECKFVDWKRDSTGKKLYFQPGTLPNSNAKFLNVIPASFTLQPGESRVLEVILSLPEGQDRQVTNSMLFVTQVSEKDVVPNKEKKMAAGAIFRVEMGIHIYNEPPQLITKNIVIEDAQCQNGVPAKAAPGDSVSQKLTVASALIGNIGERVTTGNVRFELTNKKTLEEWKSEAVEFNTLPGDHFFVNRVLPNTLAKGSYAMITVVDFGADQSLKVAESEIEIQ